MTSFALRASVLAGGVLTGFVAQAPEVAAQQSASPPDFSFNQVGWVATGEITGVAGGQPILRQDPAHAYVPNNIGRQPTYRIADLANPNLKPWVKERMKKTMTRWSPERSPLRRAQAVCRRAFLPL